MKRKFHDVHVIVSRNRGKYRIRVVEYQEHGRCEVIGQGDSIREAIGDARHRAQRIGAEYLEESLSKAEETLRGEIK